MDLWGVVKTTLVVGVSFTAGELTMLWRHKKVDKMLGMSASSMYFREEYMLLPPQRRQKIRQSLRAKAERHPGDEKYIGTLKMLCRLEVARFPQDEVFQTDISNSELAA